ncbi:peptidase inhibitor family I36 protein [Streptomyces tricolor]|uniref:peptidase inhibitor family I36 protein n=1 Tax=Streptomyces tricolor TaxID=68277 RepID=UPI00382C2A5A
MKKSSALTGAAVATAALVLGVAPPAASASPTAWECSVGDVCFWSGYGGTGQRCAFDIKDPNWHVAPVVCSWAGSTTVKSIWNRNSSPVRYYVSTNYNGWIGCTLSGGRGDLTGTYTVSSHQFTLC